MSDVDGPAKKVASPRVRRNRIIAAVWVGVLVLAGAITTVALVTASSAGSDMEATPSPAASATATSASPTPSAAAPDPIHVIAMGDMLPHDAVNANALQPDGSYNYAQFFTGIQPQIDAADLTFCNQEVPSAGSVYGVSGYPTFNAPEQFAVDLATVGCDAVNLANNHMADLGTGGIATTRSVWDTLAPQLVSGANRSPEEQNTVQVTEIDGVRIALVSFAEYSNAPIDTVSLNQFGDVATFDRLVAEARAAADIVLLSMHWGTEDSHDVNGAQQEWAQRAAAAGVDVVIGTGPHVLQPVQWVDRPDGGRTLVWYSIGNMLNTQLPLNNLTGVIAGFDIDATGERPVVTNPTAILTYMHYDWTAEQEAAGDLLARTNLSLSPLADADALLGATRFGVTAQQQIDAMAAILGPDVTIVPR